MFTQQDNAKHIVTGGFWLDSNIQCWVQAGTSIQSYMNNLLEQQRLMEIPDLLSKQPGATNLPAWVVYGKREIIPPVQWQTTEAGKQSQSNVHQIQATKLFYQVGSVVTMDGNKVCPRGYTTVYVHILKQWFIPKSRPDQLSAWILCDNIHTYTVTPKTIQITNPNTVCKVYHNHLWEVRLDIVESR